MDVNSTSKEGYSLLMEAAREGHLEVIRLLLDRKVKVNQRNAVNEDAMMLAAFKGQLETVKLLQSKGGEINKDGWTALHYAAFQGQTPVAKYLIDNKADINAKAPNGVTPLMAAARNGHYEVDQVAPPPGRGSEPQERCRRNGTAVGGEAGEHRYRATIEEGGGDGISTSDAPPAPDSVYHLT